MRTIHKPPCGIIFMLLLCVGISHAQVSRYSLIPHGNLKENSLICPSTITAGTVEYHDHGDTNEFIMWLDNVSDYPRKMELPYKMAIKSMKSFEGKVFFGGSYQGNAIVGYFDETIFNDNYSPGSSSWTAIQAINFLKLSQVSSIDDITVYSWNGETKLAAIGSTQDSSFVYIFNILEPACSYHYRGVPQFGGYKIFQDIVDTKSKIVIAGDCYTSQQNFPLTVIDKTDLNNFNIHGYIDAFGYDNNSMYCIEALEADTVVVSTLKHTSSAGFFIPLHFFDVSTVQPTPTYSVRIDVPQKTPYPGVMKYFSEHKKLVMLQRLYYYYYFDITSMFFIFDMNELTQADILHKDGHYFNSLERFDDMTFVSNGNFSTTHHNQLRQNINKYINSKCVSTDICNVLDHPIPQHFATLPKQSQLDTKQSIDYKPIIKVMTGIISCVQQ